MTTTETTSAPNGNTTTAIARKPIGYSQHGGLALRTFDDVQRFAAVLFDARYFKDCINVAQVVVKMQYAAEMGVPNISGMLNIHVIEGKPTMGATLIAARINGTGRGMLADFDKYRFKPVRWTTEVCELEWTRDAEVLGRSEFNLNDAKNAGVLSKNNWKSWPKSMYQARALTMGARMFCPEVFFGAVYTAEEIAPDNVDVDQSGNVITIRQSPGPSAADPASSSRGGSERLRQAAQAADVKATAVEDTIDLDAFKAADIGSVITEAATVVAAAAAVLDAVGATTGEAAPAAAPAKKRSTKSTPTDAGDGSAGGQPPASVQPAQEATTSAPASTATPAPSSSSPATEPARAPDDVTPAPRAAMGPPPAMPIEDVDPFAEAPPALEATPSYPMPLAEACATMPRVAQQLSAHAGKYKDKLSDAEFQTLRAYGRLVFNQIRNFEDYQGVPDDQKALAEAAKAYVVAYNEDHKS